MGCEPKSWGRGGRRGSGMVPLERASVTSYRPSIVWDVQYIFKVLASVPSVHIGIDSTSMPVWTDGALNMCVLRIRAYTRTMYPLACRGWYRDRSMRDMKPSVMTSAGQNAGRQFVNLRLQRQLAPNAFLQRAIAGIGTGPVGPSPVDAAETFAEM